MALFYRYFTNPSIWYDVVETADEKEVDEETLGYLYQVIYYLLYMYMWMCMYNSKPKLYW